jgi:hypothetical protein
MSIIFVSPIARAPAMRRIDVRGAAHALGAAAHRRVDVAQRDGLRSADDRLQAAAAQAIDRQRAAGHRQPALHARDAGQVHVLGLGMDDVAEHALADVRGVDLGTRDRFAHHACCELVGAMSFRLPP